MLTREQAADIAAREAERHRLGTRVGRVVRWHEIQGRRPFAYVGGLEDCWIAYIDTGDPTRLCSSTIVAVDRDSGRVVYRGTAGDEG
jgi:hypothetical protein